MINAFEPINNMENTQNILYSCVTCNYNCDTKGNLKRHLLTVKHAKLLNNKDKLACECGKQYLHAASLYKHKKKCVAIESVKPELDVRLLDASLITEIKHEIKNILLEHIQLSDKQIQLSDEREEKLIKQNLELHNMLVEQNEKLIELASKPNVINNTNNNTNFNLNFFLNEDCKNAINLKDFLESMSLTFTDLEETGRLGYVGGISQIIFNKMNEMDVHTRPMHCTDLKRETIYIKDNDIWEKDSDAKVKLAKFVTSVANKNERMLPAWVEQHPACRDASTDECDDYLNIARGVIGSYEIEEDIKKVVKNVIKNVVVDKSKVKRVPNV
jgi:hypothetical protein